MADLFGNEMANQPGCEPIVLIKFRFSCWNDDPHRMVQQKFDKVEVDVYAESLEQALKKMRELVKRDHHDVIKIHEPKPKV